MLLSFLIKYMEAYSKPWLTKQLWRQWKLCVLRLRMPSALPFVPPNNVIRYFELLIYEIRNNFNDECDDLIDYFEDTYIGICFIEFIKWYSVYNESQRIMPPPPSSCPPPPLIHPTLTQRYKAKIIFKKLLNFFYLCFSRASGMCFKGFRRS